MRYHRSRYCISRKNVSLSVPLVVRLEGTNVEAGKVILKESGLELTSADSLRSGRNHHQKVTA